MNSSLEALLTGPLRMFVDSGERVWWPALVGALVIAVGYEWACSRGSLAPAARVVAALKVVAHPSSRLDIKLLFVRTAVRMAMLVIIPFGAKVLAVKTVLRLYVWIGEPPVVLTGGVLVASYSVVLFLVADGARYWVHRVFHAVPLLWRFHQVHHSAEVLTPLTVYRIHPVEQVFQALRNIVVIGTVGGVFAWLSYGHARPWVLYGVPGIMVILNVMGSNLRHSHVWMPYPAAIERILISPAQHQIHHGDAAVEQQSNYGAFLAIWDWLGGSLRLSRAGRPQRFGLAAEDCNHHPGSLRSALAGPLRFGKARPMASGGASESP